jgi:hypothetical protein
VNDQNLTPWPKGVSGNKAGSRLSYRVAAERQQRQSQHRLTTARAVSQGGHQSCSQNGLGRGAVSGVFQLAPFSYSLSDTEARLINV